MASRCTSGAHMAGTGLPTEVSPVSFPQRPAVRCTCPATAFHRETTMPPPNQEAALPITGVRAGKPQGGTDAGGCR